MGFGLGLSLRGDLSADRHAVFPWLTRGNAIQSIIDERDVSQVQVVDILQQKLTQCNILPAADDAVLLGNRIDRDIQSNISVSIPSTDWPKFGLQCVEKD